MPDSMLSAVLSRVQRRWRLRSLLQAIAAGGAVFGWLLISLVAFEVARADALWIAAAAGSAAAAWMTIAGKRLSAVDAALVIELTDRSLDNLIVTAAELGDRPRPVRSEIRDEIARQAGERIRAVDPSRVVALGQPAVVALVVMIGCAVLSGRGVASWSTTASTTRLSPPAGNGSSSFTVRITPPAYTQEPTQMLEAPAQITVIAGSRIQIGAVGVAESQRDFLAIESAGLEVRTSESALAQFLSVIVVPDSPPTVRVVAPGKDTAFAKPAGQLPISIQGSDDLGLSSLVLRFTKAAGGGDNLTFTEGDLLLTIDRSNGKQWIGRAVLVLDAMGLEDGDMLVYRAIVRDSNPGGAPVRSDQYVIEIGKNAEIADAGFALPSEEKKYAISQQMVIYRTEQLLKTRASIGGGDKWIEQTRMVAIEQRMVRAEVVFLGGGEVEDELEEAARSDELAEGRLQNTGRAEMLLAINAMSRAEAQLNDGRAQEALVFERQALASLERALDRRRYFLRTMPDRSRIDVSRRLTGERKEARSWTRGSASTSVRSFDADRRMMRELATAWTSLRNVDASLAARLTALDPASAALQKAALAIAAASGDDGRRDAIRTAMDAVTARALTSLSSSSAVGINADPLAGRLADELNAARRPR
ncbi:MAG: hypothetical protein ABI039_04060 [Vicinamibacterales bacterium]